MSIYYVEGRKAGLKGGVKESHEPRLVMGQFHPHGEPPPAPAEWDGTHGITKWGMDGNDRYGSCGAAATDHYNVAAANDTTLIDTLGQPKFDGVLATYFAYGISQGEPGPEPDQGVENASWLAFLRANGIIEGYGEVPLDQIDRYAVLFGGLLMAVSLPPNADSDFEQVPPIPWGSPGEDPDPSMGHDVVFIQYDADGGHVVTWGGLEPITPDFIARYVTDCWAIFDSATAREAGFDEVAITSALDSIGGVH